MESLQSPQSHRPMIQRELAATFRRLHQKGGPILVLPNAWDAMSARVIEQAEASAIATTSAGISWSLGRPDGHGLNRDEMVDVIRRIAAAVRLPVSADIEGGYGSGTPEDVYQTVRQVIAAGAVGVNLEDGTGRNNEPLHDPAYQAERIGAARMAGDAEGVDLFINARVDSYLVEVGEPERRLEETLRRAAGYVAAGADGIFVPGVIDQPTIRLLARDIVAPLNVMAKPGAPGIAELSGLGVARVSVGPALACSVMALIGHAAGELIRLGTWAPLQGGMSYSEADGLFSATRRGPGENRPAPGPAGPFHNPE